MTRTRYVTVKETAALVRQALKRAFPGVRFSVRSKSYSGGASIRIAWTDGPSTQDVESIARYFEGSDFDPMIDLKSYHDSEWQGERVQWGADHVFCDRSYSPPMVEQAVRTISAEYGIPHPAFEDWPDRQWQDTRLPAPYGYAGTALRRILAETPA